MKLKTVSEFFSLEHHLVLLLTYSRLAGLCFVFLFLLIYSFLPLNQPIHFNFVVLPISICSLFLLSLYGYLSRNKQPNSIKAMLLLCIESILWFFLIESTGGPINPASCYFFILLALGALCLSFRQSLTLFSLIAFLYTAIMLLDSHAVHSMMGWHLWSMWLFFILTSFVLMASLHWLGNNIRVQEKAIAQYKEKTLRSEQLVMLGSVAANTAHEIATPLGVIALLAHESNHQEKRLILDAIKQCQHQLDKLRSLPELDCTEVISANAFLQNLINSICIIKPEARIILHTQIDHLISPPTLLEQSLLSLIHNAVAGSTALLTVNYSQSTELAIVEIKQEGNKIDSKLLKKLGVEKIDSTKGGLGLGYFLANASIEQLGGAVKIENTNTGVLTKVMLPLSSLSIN